MLLVVYIDDYEIPNKRLIVTDMHYGRERNQVGEPPIFAHNTVLMTYSD